MKNWQKSLRIAILTLSVSVLMGSLFLHSALAASAQIYLSPSSMSASNQTSFSVALRINPGTTVTNAQAVITYDATKLQYVAIDATGSAFETALGNQTGGSGTVTIRRGSFSGGVATDSLIASVSFKALVGNGATPIGLSPAPNTDSFDANGTSIGATLSGTTVTLTTPIVPTPTPTPTCATGQTGTYPNCVTPVKTTVSPPAVTTKPSGGGTTTPPSVIKTTPTIPGAAKITTVPTAQYSQANIAVTSDVPTRAYLKYGLDSTNLSITTPVSELATTHTLQPNPSTLIPGETYYYSVVATNAGGIVTESTVASFKLQGLSLKVGVFDQNHKPLKNAVVTLHSTPQSAKTDSKGYITFQDVIPGSHHVTYVAGKKTYTQEIIAANNIVTSGASQTAPTQNFSVVYGFTQSSFVWQRAAAFILAIVIIAVGAIIFVRRQRQLSGQPVLVGESKVFASSNGRSASLPSQDAAPADTTERVAQLKQLSGVPVLHPGSTISPNSDSNEKKEV